MKFAQYMILTVAGPGIILALTGCTGSRWLSRNDYSEMHDPFADMQTAETPGAGNSASPGSGRTSLANSESGSGSGRTTLADRGAVALDGTPRGPKPLGAAVASSDLRGRDNTVTQATYPDDGTGRMTLRTAELRPSDSTRPSHKNGPALSDFLGKNAPAPAENGLTAGGPQTATDARPSLPSGNPFGTVSSSNSRGGIPAGVTHAELDAFDQFVQSQSAGTIAPTAPTAPPMNAPPDFGVSYPAIPNATLATPTPATPAPATPAPAPRTTGSTSGPLNLQSSGIVPSLSAGANETRPSALRRNNHSVIESDLPPASDSALRSSVLPQSPSASPFENPFADLGAELPGTTAPTPGEASAARQPSAAPAAFEMDSGWKPANFTRP